MEIGKINGEMAQRKLGKGRRISGVNCPSIPKDGRSCIRVFKSEGGTGLSGTQN